MQRANGNKTDVEGGFEGLSNLTDFGATHSGQFGGATQFQNTQVTLGSGQEITDRGYKYGTTTTQGTQTGQGATALGGLSALTSMAISSAQVHNARKERAGAAAGSAQWRKANREVNTAGASVATSVGGVVSNTLSAAGQIVGAGSQVMGDAASVTAGALGAVASIIALPFQLFTTGRTIRKAAKQYARVSELQKVVTDPNMTADTAKKAWQAKQELAAALDAQKVDMQSDLNDVVARESELTRSMTPKNALATAEKLTALAAEKTRLQDVIRDLDNSIVTERTELAKLDQAKQDAEKAIKDAADRAKSETETPDDIAIYAMRKNEAGFKKKIVNIVGGFLGIGGGVAGTVAAIAIIGATGAVGAAALATPIGWALCGAAALIALGLGGFAFWKWASKKYSRARAAGQGKGRAFITAINPFEKVGTSRRERLAERLWNFAASGTPAEQAKAKETIKALGLDWDSLNMKDAAQKDSAIELIKAKMGS